MKRCAEYTVVLRKTGLAVVGIVGPAATRSTLWRGALDFGYVPGYIDALDEWTATKLPRD